MAVLVTVVGGRYSATFNSNDLGVLEDPGWKISFTPSWHNVENTDAYGATVIEQIWRGFSTVNVDFRSLEWKTGPLVASNPGAAYAATGATTFKAGLVGRRATDMALALVLTAVSGIPAASSPATATFTTVVLREGFNVEWTFGAQNRVLPIGFRVIPFGSSDTPPAPQYWAAT